MKMGVVLIGLAALAAWGSWQVDALSGRVLLAHVGLAFGGVAVAQWLEKPRVLLKSADGRLSPWSWLVFWPYHLLSRASWLGYRLAPGEPFCQELLPDLVLGARPGRRQARELCALRSWAVLDLTSEFGEADCLRRSRAYRCLPVLDHTAPSPDQLREGTAFIEKHLRDGGVYVHCAVGHGRSATVLAAFLLVRGLAATPEQAVAWLQSRRPGVRLNRAQLEVLREFGSSTRGDGGEEWFDVVDARDQVVGRERRREVHRRGLKHRAVHVLVFNSRGEVFLQKRSMTKDTFPGAWDSSASGHVNAGEDYDLCAVRELKEEIGLTLEEPPGRWFKIDAGRETGQEHVWVYGCRAEGPFTLHPEEIERGDWFSPERVDDWTRRQPGEFARAFVLIWSEMRRRGLHAG
jgi:protein-tyrosine phosphatase/isopentenyldiphosphate isomerase